MGRGVRFSGGGCQFFLGAVAVCVYLLVKFLKAYGLVMLFTAIAMVFVYVLGFSLTEVIMRAVRPRYERKSVFTAVEITGFVVVVIGSMVYTKNFYGALFGGALGIWFLSFFIKLADSGAKAQPGVHRAKRRRLPAGRAVPAVPGRAASKPESGAGYPPEIKMAAVKEYFSGASSAEEIAAKYRLNSASQLHEWISWYSSTRRRLHK